MSENMTHKMTKMESYFIAKLIYLQDSLLGLLPFPHSQCISGYILYSSDYQDDQISRFQMVSILKSQVTLVQTLTATSGGPRPSTVNCTWRSFQQKAWPSEPKTS